MRLLLVLVVVVGMGLLWAWSKAPSADRRANDVLRSVDVTDPGVNLPPPPGAQLLSSSMSGYCNEGTESSLRRIYSHADQLENAITYYEHELPRAGWGDIVRSGGRLSASKRVDGFEVSLLLSPLKPERGEAAEPLVQHFDMTVVIDHQFC